MLWVQKVDVDGHGLDWILAVLGSGDCMFNDDFVEDVLGKNE